MLLWFLYVHTCSWYVLLELFGEVITTIDNVNSRDTSCIFTVHWKGTEKQRSSKWVFNYDTMSGFIITLICQFTQHSLRTTTRRLLSCTSFKVTAEHQINSSNGFLAWVRASFSSFSMAKEFAPFCALKGHRGRPFLSGIFWVIEYLFSASPFKLRLHLQVFLCSDRVVI